jgi:predicted dithiol-disulfide oxidoreductase (DUF899 family)
MVPEIDLWRAASTAVEPILPGRGVAAGGGPHGIVKGCVEVAAPVGVLDRTGTHRNRVFPSAAPATEGTMNDSTSDNCAAPKIVDRQIFEAEVGALRGREKAHTREGDAIAAARRRLPMVAVDAATMLIGDRGSVTLLDVFEGRRLLVAYYFMWHAGRPAAAQCEGCTFYTSQVRELTYLHSRDVTYATFCQGPYAEGARYREFMGFAMPWYAAPPESLATLLVGRRVGMMHLVCYLRRGSEVFETYWTTRRGVEAMDNSYRLLDLTVYGRQENWEDSPAGWPKRAKGEHPYRRDGRPIAQWDRLAAGYSDDLGTGTG